MGDTGTGDGAAAARPRVRGAARRRLVVRALLALCLVLAVVCGALTWQYRQAEARESAQQGALDAARGTALNLATIDHTTAQRDVQRVLDGATGQFRDDFAASAESFVAVVEDTEVSTVGRSADAGIESWAGDRGTVLVQVASTVTNRSEPQERSRMWRLRMSMEKVDGAYRTATLEYLP
ncbi:mammalian cell entry protein [Rhodococcus sp. NPDC003318]|uniref:mammalian cell entry protein n=1 Tax=Rhodococcus sp. NPDC003318 TaxID=3364503 RepID=UPI00367B6B74